MSKPQAFIAFCENVREEKGDKLSLMGLLGPELHFVGHASDANLSTDIAVVLLFRLFEPGPISADFELKFFAGEKSRALPTPPERQHINLNIEGDKEVWTTQVIAKLVGLPIHDKMRIEASVSIGDEEFTAPLTIFFDS